MISRAASWTRAFHTSSDALGLGQYQYWDNIYIYIVCSEYYSEHACIIRTVERYLFLLLLFADGLTVVVVVVAAMIAVVVCVGGGGGGRWLAGRAVAVLVTVVVVVVVVWLLG